LTDPSVASFSQISSGCVGTARCTISRSLATAVPAGMQNIGLATNDWDIGSDSGPLRLNALSAHIDGLTVSPPTVNLNYLCVMQDATGQNRMFCEWAAKIVAFAPSEMEQNGSFIFPQYTFLGQNIASRQAGPVQDASPSGAKISGFLDAFEGASLFYDPLSPNPAATDNVIWWIEAFADSFAVTAPSAASRGYGVFLGTKFGDTLAAAPFDYQVSRAFGFLL
jgi:hypothetical protein